LTERAAQPQLGLGILGIGLEQQLVSLNGVLRQFHEMVFRQSFPIGRVARDP